MNDDTERFSSARQGATERADAALDVPGPEGRFDIGDCQQSRRRFARI